MTAIFILLTATIFAGGLLTVLKAGAEDGICNYGQVGEDDVQN